MKGVDHANDTAGDFQSAAPLFFNLGSWYKKNNGNGGDSAAPKGYNYAIVKASGKENRHKRSRRIRPNFFWGQSNKRKTKLAVSKQPKDRPLNKTIARGSTGRKGGGFLVITKKCDGWGRLP